MRDDVEQRDAASALRALFNGLCDVIRYGIAWRIMPDDLLPWSAVHQHPVAGAQVCTLRAVLHMAAAACRKPRQPSSTAVTLRPTPEGAPRAGYDGVRRKWGIDAEWGHGHAGPSAGRARDASQSEDHAEVGCLAAVIQDAVDGSAERTYANYGYKGEQPAGTAGGARFFSWAHAVVGSSRMTGVIPWLSQVFMLSNAAIFAQGA